MYIAVDAMGGDHAPQVVVEGAFLAAQEYGIAVLLVGDQEQILHELMRKTYVELERNTEKIGRG